MGESQIKVGDVVAWADVPIGALVVDEDACFFNRQEDGGRCVGCGTKVWESRAEMLLHDPEGPWAWCDMGSLDRCTIVALGLTGNETAAELFALAHPTP